MKEVEAKAWLSDEKKQEVLQYFYRQCRFLHETTKEDMVFQKEEDVHNQVRLRTVHDKMSLTYKIRQYSPQGLEINQELEFDVLQKESVLHFLYSLGYRFLYAKTKHVQAFSHQNMICEVVCIPELGSFLEIEILTDEENKAQNDIFQMFRDLGLQDQIEPRSYGVLLAENTNL